MEDRLEEKKTFHQIINTNGNTWYSTDVKEGVNV